VLVESPSIGTATKLLFVRRPYIVKKQADIFFEPPLAGGVVIIENNSPSLSDTT
jgi:hypothetical protein